MFSCVAIEREQYRAAILTCAPRPRRVELVFRSTLDPGMYKVMAHDRGAAGSRTTAHGSGIRTQVVRALWVARVRRQSARSRAWAHMLARASGISAHVYI